MNRENSNNRIKYNLPLTTAALTMFSVVAAATAGGLVGMVSRVNACPEKVLSDKDSRMDLKSRISALTKLFSARTEQKITSKSIIDIVHEHRMKFAADHGVDDPAALVASVKYSSMPNLLISVAIEESRGDPVAMGSAGERGAWQVKASDWGSVPRDIHGQAGQAEKIISGLLLRAKGNKKKALAHYNGGTAPPDKSYRYAERILKRARQLQAAVNHLPPNYKRLRQALLDPPGNSRILSSFFQTGIASNRAAFLS